MTLRERFVRRTGSSYRELPVLAGISFDVPRGEFLGIAGRNGSGKSTLLKILAGIYRADSGSATAAGRIAPIIELGVGFNNNLPAHDNVVMNAVIMGLTPAEARRRYRAIIEFAELGDFEHLKLSNYSSGMRARLAFAVMTHVDADIMLFDEVLAVGDARFKQKCSNTFERLRGEGRTGVLVTHSMGDLVKHCASAIVLEDGEIVAAGAPEHVAEEYERLQTKAPRAASDGARAQADGIAPVGSIPGPATGGKVALPPIAAPSAFGRDTRRFLSLLWLTAIQDFRLQYRTTALGYIWTLMRPLAYFAVLYVVFTRILRFGGTIPNYAVLLLMNLMLFQFFSDATGTAMGSVVRGEQVVRKMHFPRIVIPLAVVVTAALTSAMNLIVVLGFMLASGIEPTITWLLLPAIVIPLVVFSAGTALLLSIAYVRMRDLEHVWTVALRVLFYATPILFPLERVPESFRWVIALNPLTPILYQARVWLVQPDAPPLVQAVGVAPLAGSVLIAIAACVGGVWLFARKAPRVAEAL
jgi:ABC-2 type transport system permease protein